MLDVSLIWFSALKTMLSLDILCYLINSKIHLIYHELYLIDIFVCLDLVFMLIAKHARAMLCKIRVRRIKTNSLGKGADV